jgi:hypothetical protein
MVPNVKNDIIQFPLPAIWEWNVFGDVPNSLMLVNTVWEVPLWRRWLTTILLGSKWRRLTQKDV